MVWEEAQMCGSEEGGGEEGVKKARQAYKVLPPAPQQVEMRLRIDDKGLVQVDYRIWIPMEEFDDLVDNRWGALRRFKGMTERIR